MLVDVTSCSSENMKQEPLSVNFPSTVLAPLIILCQLCCGVSTNDNSYSVALQGLSIELLSELFIAANFLDIQPLCESLGKRIAQTLDTKSVTELRKLFGITEPGFSKEDEEYVKKEAQLLKLIK